MPSYLVTQFIAMKARRQLLLLNAEWEHIFIFTSSDMKQRDCGKLAAASALYHFDPNCSVNIKSSCKANICCPT
ncbi:hypothetical protein T07_3326 [Trichinella nelsoni]|uniref:Uncharacterized protein n=1 Tax=Trichinella nelsoni TaxID=6336 RepID=A0A0V0RSI7_9BILA|nr:hypothetical protein T07_3326 [Trichinella nelsoni]